MGPRGHDEARFAVALNLARYPLDDSLSLLAIGDLVEAIQEHQRLARFELPIEPLRRGLQTRLRCQVFRRARSGRSQLLAILAPFAKLSTLAIRLGVR